MSNRPLFPTHVGCVVFSIAFLSVASRQAVAADLPAPPTGTYCIWKNGGIQYYMELAADGSYTTSDKPGEKPTSAGTYAWDAKAGSILWTSGPHAEKKFTGHFRTEHILRLNLTFYGYNDQPVGTPSDNAKPCLGTYVVRKGVFAVTLVPNGKYEISEIGGKATSGGDYVFDDKTGRISWTSGLMKEKNYGGTFSFQQRLVLAPTDQLRAVFVPPRAKR